MSRACGPGQAASWNPQKHARAPRPYRPPPSIGAGLAAIAMALTQVLTPGPPLADYESASGLAREGLTLVLLLSASPPFS